MQKRWGDSFLTPPFNLNEVIMKNDIKQKYIKQQKKQKALTIVKWVLCGLGWTTLVGAFVGLVALGCKSRANKKTYEPTQTRIIGDYTLNKRSYNGQYSDELLFNYQSFEGPTFNELDQTLQGDDYVGGGWSYVFTQEGFRFSGRYNLIYIENATKIKVDFYVGPYGHPQQQNELFGSLVVSGSTYTGDIVSNYRAFTYTTTLRLFDNVDDAFEYYDYDEIYFWWGLMLGENSTPTNEVVGEEVIFDAQINRYAPLNLNNDMIFAMTNDYTGTFKIFDGYFRDQRNRYYTSMYITYIDAEYLRYFNSNGEYVQNSLPASCLYMGLYYEDINGNRVVVNRPITQTMDNETGWTNRSYWVDTAYQHIEVIRVNELTGSGLPIRNMEVLSAFNQNNGTGSGGSGGGVGGNGLLDALSLLSMGFKSIASILAIQVLPGITLGTLVFIPFIVLIIIAVVWLFKR